MRIFAKGWSEGFDGPGRRFVYYLKGCNFKCLWCGNPESIKTESEIMFYPEKSQFASQACPHGAVRDGCLDRVRCVGCQARPCVNVWRDRAFELSGEEISTEQIVAEVESRSQLFGVDGGVTFSGGEPTLQMDALLDAASALRGKGVHLALETNASSPRFAELPDAFDLLICDLKCVSTELHRKLTGMDNRQVLENLLSGAKFILRMALTSELNFTESEKEELRRFLLGVRPAAVEFLRMHRLGAAKYKALGIRCEADAHNPPERREVEEFCSQIRLNGINAKTIN